MLHITCRSEKERLDLQQLKTDTMTYKNKVFYALDVIQSNNKAIAELRQITSLDFEHLRAGVLEEVIKDELLEKILKIVPICYEINDKIFLEGETKGDFDFIDDGNIDYQTATELMDMSTEMIHGDSYSFYVSTTVFFDRASWSDTIRVKEFLKSLN